MTEEPTTDDFDPDALRAIQGRARARQSLAHSMTSIGEIDPMTDPTAWLMNLQITAARDAAVAAGEELYIPDTWRETDMPLVIRERLAHWHTVASVKQWEAECEKVRAKARAPFLAFSASVTRAIPRRYVEARPLPAATDPEHEAVKILLRARLKSSGAYRMARAAAHGVAEGRVRQVLLVGPSGAGKSTIAAIMLKMVADYFAERWAQAMPPLREAPATGPDAFLYRPPPPLKPGFSIPKRRHEVTHDVAPNIGAWNKLAGRFGFQPGVEGNESPVQWATARDVFRAAANPTPPRFGEDPVDPLRKWKMAPLVMLDDIGGEPEQRNIEAIDGVLWHRHDEDDDVVTITTTGFFDPKAVPHDIEHATEDEIERMLTPLSARYGVALVRRLAEPGQSVIIPVIPPERPR